MRCIDGLCGDDACWYCSRKRTPKEDSDDLYDRDPMHGDEYEGLIEHNAPRQVSTRSGDNLQAEVRQ